MKNKKIISYIQLNVKEAIVNNEASELSLYDICLDASENEVDEILVDIISKTDEDKDASLNLLKEVIANNPRDFIGRCNAKKMEDIKKIIYAGFKRAVVSVSADSDMELYLEVAKKFGKDKIICELLDNNYNEAVLEKISKYSDEVMIGNVEKVSVFAKSKDVANTLSVVKNGIDSIDTIFNVLSNDKVTAVVSGQMAACASKINQIKKEAVEKNIKVDAPEYKKKWTEFKLDEKGLLPVVVQDVKTNEVLMLAYMNEESYEMTLRTKVMTYYSRSRKELWIKGKTSGHLQFVKSLYGDCDSDTLLAKVVQIGGCACHTGAYSCFFDEIIGDEYEETNISTVLEEVYGVIIDRKNNPKEGSYTNYLFEKGIDKILKKLGEEATEIIIAAKNPNPEEIKYEVSDFLYHLMVLMACKDVKWEEIMIELANR